MFVYTSATKESNPFCSRQAVSTESHLPTTQSFRLVAKNENVSEGPYGLLVFSRNRSGKATVSMANTRRFHLCPERSGVLHLICRSVTGQLR